jgi:hypothetical protein
MQLPTIIICIDASKDVINAILQAQGRGPDNISVPLCAIDPEATWETPPTHWYMQDMSATDNLVASWQEYSNGTLPEIVGTWGEGIISEQDALAAVATPGSMLVFTATGFESTTDRDAWRDNSYGSQGLQRVPDRPE